ncbi:MAG: DUF2529 family protein [Bacillus sp. (in: firmicutes)]
MLKIFSTQLSGIFKKIADQEYTIEDAARLLAQATVGDGHIYICGMNEMQGVLYEAIEGIEALPYFQQLPPTAEAFSQLSTADRVIIITRYHNDQEAIDLAQRLYDQHIPFVALSTIQDEAQDGIQALADVHLDLHVKRGLVPTETGERTGFPSLLVALYAFHGISLTLKELLDELED